MKKRSFTDKHVYRIHFHKFESSVLLHEETEHDKRADSVCITFSAYIIGKKYA